MVNGSKLARRDKVAHAIRLGREAGAVQAISGLRRDLAWADEKLAKKIAKAEALEQMTAVSRLTQHWLKLQSLLVERIDQRVGHFSIIIGRIYDDPPIDGDDRRLK